ncbi:MAG TPA: serine/threonine-protein kinase [Gemmataceae bacterium]|nr:serine/threonine-protein kinase [Gemmataceae bacterium]
MKFTYSSGQRPLDGYVLKRGIGRGGFGEVYFAVSDGGKEVALKLLRGGSNNEVELRGVAQCLNLKHPSLVALYDLKTDAQGDPWVVMEYVSGEPLSVVLNRHPQGLPSELAQQWFLALAKATACLHDHGIVHRDLKPGNIFLENGTVKVGDYGLSKFISGSQRTAQTQSVGTVHYMAPEISTGNYGKQIDVYAAGIILYEMLTGRVPFDGESAGEILMKHLTSPPDLTKLPTEYLPIVAKALSKNPAHRYASMAEMARAVEAVGTRPAPVARPRPTTAQQPAAPVSPPRPRPRPREDDIPSVLPVPTLRGQIAELSGSMALAVIFALLGATLWYSLGRIDNLADIGTVFFLTVATTWAVLVPGKVWAYRKGDPWRRRLVMMFLGVLIGIGALWLNGWVPTIRGEPGSAVRHDLLLDWPLPAGTGLAEGAAYVIYFAVTMFPLRWWRLTDPRRSARFSFLPLLAAGFWSLLPLLIWPQPWPWGTGALVMAAAIVQLVSPWEQPIPTCSRRLRLRYS